MRRFAEFARCHVTTDSADDVGALNGHAS
jgi:hypothetical protein